MLSDEETRLLNRFLREVPPRGRIADIEFNEEQIQEQIESLSFDESELPRGWKQFFRSRSKKAMEDGEAIGETVEMYHLSPDLIVEEWVEEIDDRPWFAGTHLEEVDDESWRLTAESDGYGDLVFRLFFNGERAEAYSPDILKGKFGVWFVDPGSTSESENMYKWTELLKKDFWESLRRHLLRVQSPRTEEICRKDSVAANDNMEGIQACIKKNIKGSGIEVEDYPEEEVTSIEQYIDGSILFGAKEDDSSYLLVCECDLSPDHVHLHYFRDGIPAFLRESTHADDISTSVRKKVEYYNTLSAEKEDASRVIRPAGYIIGGMLAVQFVPIFSFFGIDPNSQIATAILATGITLVIITAILLLAYLLRPIVAFRKFSWGESEGRLRQYF